MTSLRAWVDGTLVEPVENTKPEFKAGDQVLLRRNTGRTRLSVKEILCGTIVSLSGDGSATITLSRPYGKLLRTTVPVDRLEPASAVYKRSRVNVNPAFRQIYVGRV